MLGCNGGTADRHVSRKNHLIRIQLRATMACLRVRLDATTCHYWQPAARHACPVSQAVHSMREQPLEKQVLRTVRQCEPRGERKQQIARRDVSHHLSNFSSKYHRILYLRIKVEGEVPILSYRIGGRPQHRHRRGEPGNHVLAPDWPIPQITTSRQLGPRVSVKAYDNRDGMCPPKRTTYGLAFRHQSLWGFSKGLVFLQLFSLLSEVKILCPVHHTRWHAWNRSLAEALVPVLRV